MAEEGGQKLEREELEKIRNEKSDLLKEFLAAQPPVKNGEDLLSMWENIFDDDMKNVVVKTVSGPSDDENFVFPYEKIQAVVGDGGTETRKGDWKWPRMWQRYDEIERRGTAYREGEELNFNSDNKNTNIVSQRVLIVGGGPIGIRLSIEMAMAGHLVTLVEKRRTIRDEDGHLTQLGFTNRINRPHMWPFVRNDLAKLNGKDLMSREAAYPVFTEPETSSIGIDELQCLLIKNALMLGVDFRMGVGYVNAKMVQDETNLMPHWDVELNYDEHAAEYFGKEVGTNREDFDCLIGCDGPRSTVRDTQQKYFGNVEKRKFMDSVGIVANVRKVNRKRLKELGFEFGQEPSDMNRSKLAFKQFFKELQTKADADIETLIYYKASFHNYVILVPKRADLIKHGLSGKVYNFHAARDASSDKAKEQMAEKEKLKNYCLKVLNAAGIPVDEKLPNGGFVDVPNDCMAFDFAECWNTKKSMAFGYPPPDYDVETDGDWEGGKINAFIALAGDSLLEPFWPMGLGLKRGWQAIMDTCYAVDNIFNRLLLCTRKGGDPEHWTWEQHYEALAEQCARNFDLCSSLRVSEELGKGEYFDKGPVMTQLKKIYKDAEKPMYLVEVDPWTRYEPLEKEAGDAWKNMSKVDKEQTLHPVVKRALALKEWYDEHSKGSKGGEIEYTGKELISINGKVSGGYKQIGKRKSVSTNPAPKAAGIPGMGMALPGMGGMGKPPPGAMALPGMGGGKPDPMARMAQAMQMAGGNTAVQGTAAKAGSMAALMAGGGGGLMGALPKRVEATFENEGEEISEVLSNSRDLFSKLNAMLPKMKVNQAAATEQEALDIVKETLEALSSRVAEFKEAEEALQKHISG